MNSAGAPTWDESILSLGTPEHDSPLRLGAGFVAEDAHVRAEIDLPEPDTWPRWFEKAGPRAKIFFRPRETTVGLVTAGGLCPGLNDVVRSLVLALRHGYGVERILGFRFGFAGLDPAEALAPVPLGLSDVRDIHARGGSILGTSRGPHDVDAMVETLRANDVDVLFAIGGDGTMHAAHALHQAAVRRGVRLGVVGIPKTIDNDIPFVDKTFGFDTAVATARLVIEAAHAEARSVRRGIGLVKLMGRQSGLLAAHATLASREVNACLIPEVPFEPDALLGWLDERLASRGHAVIVVAEGCADQVLTAAATDPSGNARYAAGAADVGPYLRDRIERHFVGPHAVTLKYLDPSYLLRGLRATSDDATLCDALARNAAHAAMAGKTAMMVGRWHRAFTHVPLPLVFVRRRAVDPRGDLWRSVCEVTGQPPFGP